MKVNYKIKFKFVGEHDRFQLSLSVKTENWFEILDLCLA